MEARQEGEAAGPARIAARLDAWLERADPGAHRRVKGLRLVTAYAIAWMGGTLQASQTALPGADALGSLAAGFALWASVSEGSSTRAASGRDLVLLVLAAMAGATITAALAPTLAAAGRGGPELTLVSGAFCAAYLRRFGVLGAGLGSQIYIGQLVAYGVGVGPAEIPVIGLAGAIATAAAVAPRLLSGPAEHPTPPPAPVAGSPWLRMGAQAALAALAIVALNAAFGLVESVWAITACTYVIASSTSGTRERVLRRIAGTAVGVPLGIACLPLLAHLPLLVWCAAALALVIYAMALPERYDIACGAYAFVLVVSLAAGGEHALPTLLARIWETIIGGALGLATATILPLRPARAA